MRYRTYVRKVAARRNRFVNGASTCHCFRCQAKRPTSRPADYEPDFDGPVNASKRAMWAGRE